MKAITKYGEQSLKTKETSFSFQNVFYETEQQSLRFNIDLRWFNNKLCLLRGLIAEQLEKLFERKWLDYRE